MNSGYLLLNNDRNLKILRERWNLDEMTRRFSIVGLCFRPIPNFLAIDFGSY